MKSTITLMASGLSLVLLSGCLEDSAPSGPATPAVGSSTDLSAFQGARAGQAEMGIQALGYKSVRTKGLTAWWFNPETGACARIVTSDGKYSSVTMLPAQDC